MLKPYRPASWRTAAPVALIGSAALIGVQAASSLAVRAAEPTLVAQSATAPPATMGSPGMVGGNRLVGSQEVPPVDTPASAISTIAVGDDMTVTGGLETNGIDGTAAHIHQGAPGENGPVLITLAKTSATQWSVPAGATLTEAQYASYKAGDLYVNVHSAAHKNGEIRLQLKP